MPPLVQDTPISVLLAQSEAFGLLAALVREPDTPAAWDGLPAQAAAAYDRLREAGAATAPAAHLVGDMRAHLVTMDVEAAFRQTFGHIPAGMFSPYETSYGGQNAFSQSQTLADINGFYRAFGVQPARGYQERPDHLGVELEFLAFVLWKEAQARADGRTEEAALCRDVRRRFLEAHLGRWAPVVFERLERDAGAELYRICGALGGVLLAREFADTGAACAAAERGGAPPPGIVEDFDPDLLQCPHTAGAGPFNC